MDEQQKFITNLIMDLEDIKFDVECDLGIQSVPYEKLKSLLSTVEEYQETLI